MGECERSYQSQTIRIHGIGVYGVSGSEALELEAQICSDRILQVKAHVQMSLSMAVSFPCSQLKSLWAACQHVPVHFASCQVYLL